MADPHVALAATKRRRTMPTDPLTPESLAYTLPRGSTPVPDPTELTDKAIAKAIAALSAEHDGFKVLVDQRFEMAQARESEGFRNIGLQFVLLNRERLEQFASLKELMESQLSAMQTLVNEKFESAERQRVEQKLDTKQAVDAALSAAKEAVREQTTASERSIAKSEAATTKQLEQQQQTTSVAVDGLRRSLDELKERLGDEVRTLRAAITDVASTANASVQQKVGAKEDRSTLYAGVGISITILLAALTIIGFIIARSGAAPAG